MNIYDTLTMLKAVEQIYPVHTFLRTMFFPHTADEALLTEQVIIDFKKGNRKMAPFVAPRVGGVTISREGYTTSTITAPRIAPQRVLTLDDIDKRSFGEAIVSTKTPEERQAAIIAADFAEMGDMIDRREEFMLRELLFTGKVNVKGYVDFEGKNTVDQEINYGAVEALTPTALWSAAGAKIFEDLRLWRQQIIKKTGKAPTVAIVASDVADALLNDAKIQKLLDLKNLNIGQINPVATESSTFIGRITALNLDLYSYDEWFVDETTGEEEPMIPAGKVLLGNRNLGSFKYGIVTQMEKGAFKSYVGTKVPKLWADEANDRRMVRLTSRPVPVPENLDAWAVGTVL